VYAENPASAKKLLAQWLKKHKPDALLTSLNSVPAMIKELGYNIPKDIAVAGTTIYDVPVDAGINQNPEAIGRTAVEMLVAQIHRNERGVPEAPSRTLVESLWQDGKSLPVRSH
jgi:LacI family transcriptional regulator